VDAAGAYYYKLVAVDIHGNLSRYAVVSPSTPTAILASLVSFDAQPTESTHLVRGREPAARPRYTAAR
jgi:hypothetical protein